MGTIGSKMGREFEQKGKAKWVKKKENLVKACSMHCLTLSYSSRPTATVAVTVVCSNFGLVISKLMPLQILKLDIQK